MAGGHAGDWTKWKREVDDFDERLDLGQIGIACAIGIIDFRNPNCGLARNPDRTCPPGGTG